MYYLSGDGWVTDENEKMESVYTLKKCKSFNGIIWFTGDGPILKSVQKNECQTSASVFDYNG